MALAQAASTLRVLGLAFFVHAQCIPTSLRLLLLTLDLVQRHFLASDPFVFQLLGWGPGWRIHIHGSAAQFQRSGSCQCDVTCTRPTVPRQKHPLREPTEPTGVLPATDFNNKPARRGIFFWSLSDRALGLASGRSSGGGQVNKLSPRPELKVSLPPSLVSPIDSKKVFQPIKDHAAL